MKCNSCGSPLMRDEQDAWALVPSSDPTCWRCQDEVAGDDDAPYGPLRILCAAVLVITLILAWFAAVIPWSQIVRQHSVIQEATR